MERYEIEKVANAIILALDLGVKYLGKTKLMKLLFFADKEHLKKYGRPIFYDNYIKEKKGPVPSITYSIISSYNDKERDDFGDEVKKLLQWIEIDEKDIGYSHPMMIFRKKREFNPEIFSRSEIEILKGIFEKFKELTAEEISEISHKLPEYKETSMYGIIPYESMAEDMADYVKFWREEREAFEKALK
jgi:uncharacterized phage-associated protein